MASAAALPEPIFIRQIKREFRHLYTPEKTPAEVVEEAQGLVRTALLLIQHLSRPSNFAEPGTISFEIEEGATVCIVRIRGAPALVDHATTIFNRVEGWVLMRRQVTVRATTNIRTIPGLTNAVTIAERAWGNGPVVAAAAAAAGGGGAGSFVGARKNRSGTLKANLAPVAAVKPRLTVVAERLGLPVETLRPVLRNYTAYYRSLQPRYPPREARVLADEKFWHILRGTFIPLPD